MQPNRKKWVYDIEYLKTEEDEEAGETIMNKARRAGKDQELSRALSENVDGNFERLIRVFQDRLYSFSLRLTNNRADAEEIVQEGFVRAYRALKAYPPQRVELIDLETLALPDCPECFSDSDPEGPLPAFFLRRRQSGLRPGRGNCSGTGPGGNGGTRPKFESNSNRRWLPCRSGIGCRSFSGIWRILPIRK